MLPPVPLPARRNTYNLNLKAMGAGRAAGVTPPNQNTGPMVNSHLHTLHTPPVPASSIIGVEGSEEDAKKQCCQCQKERCQRVKAEWKVRVEARLRAAEQRINEMRNCKLIVKQGFNDTQADQIKELDRSNDAKDTELVNKQGTIDIRDAKIEYIKDIAEEKVKLIVKLKDSNELWVTEIVKLKDMEIEKLMNDLKLAKTEIS